jgi:protoporphyrinogen oxidase
VQQLWEELLGDDLLVRPRLSRIYYGGRFFDYPLRPVNALFGLGPVEALRIGLSYLAARRAPHPDEQSFEDWVCNRFGRRLYEIFFETYTEKVWGMPPAEISADWAAQRIKNLDLLTAVRRALLGSLGSQEIVTTLIDRFYYPRLGPGMMWERCRERLDGLGVPTRLETAVTSLHHDAGRIRSVAIRDARGREERLEAEHVISSMPLGELVQSLDPAPPAEVLSAAKRLRYRDFISVVLVVNRAEVFPDNWIYIHAPEVTVGRVQNYKNWSPEMVPDPAKTALGLEYFAHEGDELWSAPDAELLELGRREVEALGLIDAAEVEDGTVVRMPKAYPVYDGAYQSSVAEIREYLAGFANLESIGRNGQHRYNNQDHSMLAGVYAARNVTGAAHDVWSVNVELDYHEEGSATPEATSDRQTPALLERPDLEALLRGAFARYDPLALGVAVGAVAGTALFLATALLLLRGGESTGANLSLLGNYLLGFRISWGGAFLGLAEAALGGFALGYGMARAINGLVGSYESRLRRRLELERVMDPLEQAS